MRDIPFSAFAHWPIPNYVNPQTRGPAIHIVNGIFLFFMTAVMIARVYTRSVIKRSLGWDDASMVVGYLFTVGLTIAVLLANAQYYW
jgi:hypothetical protein